jgi:signal transduction histidine kinase
VFRASFRKYFSVHEAASAAEALDLFAKRDVPVLVADQRMPDMTGVELCEIVSREYPHTICMILTGYADPEAMMDAINRGHVYSFVTKPWEREALLSILLRGFEAHDLAISNNALLERVDHAERCATLGRLAAGVAHEIRNQLFVLPLVELIEAKYRNDEELMQLASVARDTHDRLTHLVGEVMDFVRKDGSASKRTSVNLSDLVRETLSLAVLDKNVPRDRLKLEVHAEPRVYGHKAKLQQVLFNLVRNAADAIGVQANGEVTAIVDQAGPNAILSVRDNDGGIDPGHMQKIWEPFFSTKGEAGNGLGLDVCRRIVEAHNGTISCDSNPGDGATFNIRLPLIEGTEAA